MNIKFINKKLTFRDIDIGDCFLCNDIAYIKTEKVKNETNNFKNAICLVDGYFTLIDDSDFVYRCEATVNIRTY